MAPTVPLGTLPLRRHLDTGHSRLAVVKRVVEAPNVWYNIKAHDILCYIPRSICVHKKRSRSSHGNTSFQLEIFIFSQIFSKGIEKSGSERVKDSYGRSISPFSH